MPFPVPSHYGQIGAPIWPAASWPALVPPWVTLLGPRGSVPLGSNLSRACERGLSELPIGRTTSGTLLTRATLPTTTLVGITMGWALRFLKQISTWEEPGHNSPYVAVNTMELGKWDPWAGLASTWTCTQCPQMSVLPWMLMVPTWRDGDLPVWYRTCPWTCDQDIIAQEQ